MPASPCCSAGLIRASRWSVALGTLGWQAGVASAVPEPSAAWLAAGGAVLVGLGVRRRGRPVASA
ncbi:PEP-CTERM sorting domain-containing protein [Pseudaquabacterium rugosum]|uniref:PEP-CTERM sorting domain-containing protein n=1 Tax=Pseudaquabacterium rugosum TaxID=2984194 RepID=A0ABU9BE48_9BURK